MIADDVWAKWWSLWTDQFLLARNMAPRSQAATAEFRSSMERRLTTEEFDEAARLVFDTAKWFPTPGEVVEGVRDRIETRGVEAWADVLAIIASTAAGERIPKFRALHERSWRALASKLRDGSTLCGVLDDEPQAPPPARDAFLRAYREFVEAELQPRRIKPSRSASIRSIGDALDQIERQARGPRDELTSDTGSA